MQEIDRQAAQQMHENGGVTFVEVLDTDKYLDFHIPGAINVPVGGADFEKTFQDVLPDKHQPIVVYCMDKDCDASVKAAKKLDALGYERVYDYVAGKMDWKKAGNSILQQGQIKE